VGYERIESPIFVLRENNPAGVDEEFLLFELGEKGKQ